jgi:hypothetical protein
MQFPIVLSASQSWSIDGNAVNGPGSTLDLLSNVSGASDALAIKLSHSTYLGLDGSDVEVGPVSITGGSTTNIGGLSGDNGVVRLGSASSNGFPVLTGSLNGTDSEPVTLTDAGLFSLNNGTVGPPTATGSDILIGGFAAPAVLTVTGGVNLDPATILWLGINQAGATPGADYSQLRATSNIDLAEAHLTLTAGNGSCPTLNPGDVDILVTTSGSLTGTSSGIPDGSMLSPANCTPDTQLRIDYTGHDVTATVLSSTSLPSNPSPPTTSTVPPPSPPPPSGYAETVGGLTHTWTNYMNADGTQGPVILTGQTVQVACKVQGFRVADGNTWWYEIASSPWNGAYYASADAFYNNGRTTGSLRGTPFVDNHVPDCPPPSAGPPPGPLRPPHTYPVIHSSGGIYWRATPSWDTSVRIAGNGFYPGTMVTVTYYRVGARNVPGSANLMWEYGHWYSGRGHGAGWINEHFVDDRVGINQHSPGIPSCGGGPGAIDEPHPGPSHGLPSPSRQPLTGPMGGPSTLRVSVVNQAGVPQQELHRFENAVRKMINGDFHAAWRRPYIDFGAGGPDQLRDGEQRPRHADRLRGTTRPGLRVSPKVAWRVLRNRKCALRLGVHSFARTRGDVGEPRHEWQWEHRQHGHECRRPTLRVGRGSR